MDISHFEYWSQLCWRTLFPVMVRAQPAYRVIRKKTFRRPHILLVVGSIGSGKSSATRYLVRNFGYSEVSSGRQIAKMLGVPPVPETPRAEFQEMALRLLRKEGGADRIAEALLTAAKRYDAERVVIDGIRQLSVLRILKARAPMPVAILFVHAAPDVAFELYAGRGRHRGEGSVEPEAFMRMLNAPVEREVPFMISEADVVVYNWSGEAGYGKALSALADELGLNRRVARR